jgi:hypothetical protein
MGRLGGTGAVEEAGTRGTKGRDENTSMVTTN